MTFFFSGILFICSLVVSFAALALRARAANDTTRAQINNIPSKSHFIVLLAHAHKPNFGLFLPNSSEFSSLRCFSFFSAFLFSLPSTLCIISFDLKSFDL